MIRLRDYFAGHPVFTTVELAAFHRQAGSGNIGTLRVLLSRQHARGTVLCVRRGVYVVVPLCTGASDVPMDPVLIASRLAPDAVIGYHSALEFHGHAQSVFRRVQFLTRTAARPCSFRATQFQPVRVPRTLRSGREASLGVEAVDRMGLSVRVTTIERTCVDVLDRPDLGGGWEEVWRSLEAVPRFDLDALAAYALRLGNATTVAKVGYFLELNASRLGTSDALLRRLRRRIPKSKHYIDRGSRHGHRLAPRWNLMVPLDVAEQSWREPG